MANAHESVRQHMHQEPSDKFIAVQLHDLGLAVPIVFVSKMHLIAFYADESAITDSDLVAVSGQVADHCLGSVDAGLTVDHPVFLH